MILSIGLISSLTLMIIVFWVELYSWIYKITWLYTISDDYIIIKNTNSNFGSPATKSNVTNKTESKGFKKNIFEFTYYNYNKKSYHY